MLKFLVASVLLSFGASAAVAQQSAQGDGTIAEQESDEAQRSDQSQDNEQGTEAEAVTPQDSGAPKTLAGMSILGNEEAPKSLVIVPWKSSEIGDGLGVTDAIDDRARPVDKEVFLREVHYYELRSGAGG